MNERHGVQAVFQLQCKRRRHHSENLSTDQIISKWILKETEWEGVDWNPLDQDREERQALVNTVMKLASIEVKTRLR
jgi:hypothetical protein